MNKALFSSRKDDWGTPDSLFDPLHEFFHFTVDAAASESNAKLDRSWTAEDSGLDRPWAGERVWLNPPRGREIGKWMRKCWIEWARGCPLIVALVPARTDTRWFHDFVYHCADVSFLKGRVRVEVDGGPGPHPAPFPSMLAIWRNDGNQ